MPGSIDAAAHVQHLDISAYKLDEEGLTQ